MKSSRRLAWSQSTETTGSPVDIVRVEKEAVDPAIAAAISPRTKPNNHDFSVSSNFNQAVSPFKRSGHARLRRGPPVSSSDPISCSVYSQLEDKLPEESPAASKENRSDAASFQSMTSSFAGGSLEGSVSNGRQLSSLGIVTPALSFSSRKPPLPSSHRKRHSGDRPSASVSRTACHCCKRRKSGSKHEVRRIPIIGSKIESILADDYSWKKYGEKKVDGSP
ncbi:hypothetical protein R6Q59_001508 [Mikania micrantha]